MIRKPGMTASRKKKKKRKGINEEFQSILIGPLKKIYTLFISIQFEYSLNFHSFRVADK